MLPEILNSFQCSLNKRRPSESKRFLKNMIKITQRRKHILFLFLIILLIWLSLKYTFTNINSSQEFYRRYRISKLHNAEHKNISQKEPCYLKDKDEIKNDSYHFYHRINLACSNLIPIDRNIPETRPEGCRNLSYPENLPRTSVIILLENAAWSTLLRAVHSVLNRTPPELLEEIILVDDSTRTFSIQDLKTYIKKFKGKVKFIQRQNGEKWKRPKSVATGIAEGEVLVFLDPYSEVNTNWLPPLLAPIYNNSNVITVPIIDIIDHTSFKYYSRTKNITFQGIFDWDMRYKETELLEKESTKQKSQSDPYVSPTFNGEIFAINRKFFFNLGGFGTHLLTWGEANLDLSFKIWMCGGSIIWIPCSRVGHIHKHISFFSSGKVSEKNSGFISLAIRKRIVEMWLDPSYKKYFYTRVPEAKFSNPGSIAEEMAQKNELKCKNFDWYMKNVAHDVLKIFPQPPRNQRWGKLLSVATGYCVSTITHGFLGLVWMIPCSNGSLYSKTVRLNEKGQLGMGDQCIDGDERGIWKSPCIPGTVDGPWKYSKEDHTFLHLKHKKCMALKSVALRPFLASCDAKNNFHKWIFKPLFSKVPKINIKRIDHFYVDNYD